MFQTPFQSEIARFIWDSKYRYRQQGRPVDDTIDDTWQRVVQGVAGIELQQQAAWRRRFLNILQDFSFLPGGRILAGTGVAHDVTLFNCFVMGQVEDSLEAIFQALKEGALTMQQGGGVGYDFSNLRPQGSPARRVGAIASGPVSVMRIWDAMCDTLISSGARRGAMMASLRCDHPDIEAFIEAKRQPGELRHFNLSVQISDQFVAAVHGDDEWPLIFPTQGLAENGLVSGDIIERTWSDPNCAEPCRVVRIVKARELWERLMRATYEYAEPGVLFIDTINRMNNLAYREQITTTNPCGEVPLPAYGACNLGCVNLTRFIKAPFHESASIDLDAVVHTVTQAVRFLDNVIDLSGFPLQTQQQQAQGTRRIGLGITGLADALIMLGLHYAEAVARDMAAKLMASICHSAYRASIELAKEKGAFPYFQADAYLQSPFIRTLPDDIQQGIARHGMRNSHLTAVAPAGTISLLANNVSSGIEPVFAFNHRRRIRQVSGQYQEYDLTDYAWQLWRGLHPGESMPEAFVASGGLSPRDHLRMQGAIQPYVDSAISKTINIPSDYPYEAFKSLYIEAHDLGLKGCTSFRPNPVSGEILSSAAEAAHHCPVFACEAD
ncbi:MAG: ribonucleoside-diphosphate reductase, adenosylcobalamin-dependent [gamma proteobacterium symbiont of Ctena orbiculata]|nr:MAG: ribonucleoside-diphosphate reductase, adenosylcobalamin-dependent [gamma proteobacterium symbiont of Ctena orbiculata]PVV19024.1 MAG: ribonucleoside-diphosphate reductase, adenosylcobalamin-dependent [gamma proteobacterium symbiont of Ctena orbiculata]